MKTKHVVAIGILTAIAVGLLAIGIKITGQKPKVQTKAEDSFINYEYGENGGWQIIGNTGDPRLTSPYTNPIYNVPTFHYNFIKSPSNEYGDEVYRLDISYWITAIKGQNTETITDIHKTNYALLPKSKTINWINLDATCYFEVTAVGDEYWGFDINANIGYTDATQTIITTYFEYSFQTGTKQFYAYQNKEITTIQVNRTIETLDYTYQTGYTTGYQIKGDLADGNFLSIQETMLDVLTMPFTFISQGFNVTLWEGTPYQINIGNFIKSLIAIATILFIIKMFTSGFSVIGNYTSGTGANISQWRKNRSERKLNESKARLNDRTNPNHKTRDSHVTIKKE